MMSCDRKRCRKVKGAAAACRGGDVDPALWLDVEQRTCIFMCSSLSGTPGAPGKGSTMKTLRPDAMDVDFMVYGRQLATDWRVLRERCQL